MKKVITKESFKKDVFKVLEDFDYLGDILYEEDSNPDSFDNDDNIFLKFLGRGFELRGTLFLENKGFEKDNFFITLYFCEGFCPWSACEIFDDVRKKFKGVSIDFGQCEYIDRENLDIEK